MIEIEKKAQNFQENFTFD